VQRVLALGREDRRKSYRIAPEFQNRFRTTIMVLALVISVIALLLSLSVAWVVAHRDSLPETLWIPVSLTLVGVGMGMVVVLLCDRLSHRYCGPAFRMMRTLQGVRRGERPEPIRLRSKDEFHDLAEELNATLQQLGAMDGGDRR
jgi:hypothetical protein